MTDERHYWQVRIALERDEWDAMRRAMFLVAPSERWDINLEAGADGETATLQIEVLAITNGEAEDLAEQAYANARYEAGLPERPSWTTALRR